MQEVFIVGHERSGTSLVRAILDAHGGFAIPPNDADILALLDQQSNGWDVPRERLDNLEADEKLQAWGLDWQKLVARLSGEPCNKGEVLREILCSFWARNPEKKRAMKRPKYERHIGLLRQVFPDCRFIALIRDPRAVLASKKYYEGRIEGSWNFANILYIRLLTSIRRWQNSIACIRHAEKTLGAENVLVINYESLVRKPQESLHRLFTFTGDSYDEKAIFQSVAMSFRSNSTFLQESTDRQIFRQDAIDRWKDKLQPVELWLIEAILGKAITAEGLSLSDPLLSVGERQVGAVNLMLFALIAIFRR